MTIATATVFTRKKPAVAMASRSGVEETKAASCEDWKINRVAYTARAMVQKLKAIWTAFNFFFVPGRHWIRLEIHPTSKASSRPICVTATRINGRLTDMLPVIPGNLTFILADRQAIRRKETKRPA